MREFDKHILVIDSAHVRNHQVKYKFLHLPDFSAKLGKKNEKNGLLAKKIMA